MYKFIILIHASVTMLLFSGCSTQQPAKRYTPLDRPTKTTEIEPQDIRRTCEKMVDSLLSSQRIRSYVSNRQPVLDVEPIQNRTTKRIDTVSLTDSMRTQLLRSGMFRFVDRSANGTAATDIERMNQDNMLGLVDSSQAAKTGQQTALDMYLVGRVSEIRNESGRAVDQYYKFSMILKDLRSGEIVWAEEQEIRKEGNR